jgi:hypothetical protein
MSFITVLGENQIAVKQGGGGPLNVSHFVLANITGLGAEPVDRIEAMPAGGDIVATLAVTDSGYVNGNQVVYSLVMDSTVGDFDFNWIGLKDDEDVLIAVAYVPTISKTATAGTVPGNNMTRNFLIAFSGIAATAAIAVPASTWQIDFNARLLGIDDRERLSNFDIYDQAAFFGSGCEVVRQALTTTYDIFPGLGYVGGVRGVNSITQQVVAASPPKAVWLDVSLEGDISDVSPVVEFIVDAAAHSDYTDGSGFDHYVTKIADIAADGVVTDLRVEADHEVKVDPHPQYLVQAATEAAAGIVERATQAEVDAGTDDARYVSPKKLRFGISSLLATNGYIAFPPWLGGLIIQWGRYGTTGAAMSGRTINVSFPLLFPSVCYTVISTPTSSYTGASAVAYSSLNSWTTSYWTTTFYTQGYTWIAIGK